MIPEPYKLKEKYNMDIQKQIKILEKQKQELLIQESKEAWDKWFKEGEQFLQSIINKHFVIKRRDNLTLFKYIKYSKGGWATSDNWKGWFQLHTEGHFSIRSVDHIYGSGSIDFINKDIDQPLGTFKFKKRSNKNKCEYISQIDYNKMDIIDDCSVDLTNNFYIGYRNSNKPNNYAFEQKPEISVKSWLLQLNQWYEVPDDFYNECFELVNFNVNKSKQIFDKWEKILPDCKLIKSY